MPPPVEADTNEDDWGVFSKVERVYKHMFLRLCDFGMIMVCWYESGMIE